MKVLVTGACGFLGSHVADRLRATHDVYGIDNLTTGQRNWWTGPESHLEIDSFPASVELDDSEAVIHCAAIADISQNWTARSNRHEIFDANIEQVYAMLERLNGSACKRLVFISSAAVTSSRQSPYTASKLAGEALCRAYCQRYGIGLAVIRPVSMLGQRYHHGHVRDFVRMAKEHGEIRSLDNGHQRKPYCHVSQVVDSIENAIEANGLPWTEVIPGAQWSVTETARLLGVPFIPGTEERGWPGDPDVDAYRKGDAREWFEETIAWVKESYQ